LFASAPVDSATLARWRQQEQNVTIIRDNWGIAHVYGKTDADAVFGMEYAQAEDDFNRVETNYIKRQQLRPVVEFGNTVKAYAVTAGGQSDHPSSRHFDDHVERYSTGNLREVYFYRAQLRGHTEREYHRGN
jgi:acyl-homoserine lactone acylase PvdQ